MADKNRIQQKAPHGRAKACMTGKRALAFTLSVLLAWMLAMPSVTSATTDDGTGAEEVAAATTQEESSVSSKAADTDASAAAAADASANDSSAAASGSASETSADSKTSSSDTAQNSAATSENVSGGGASEAGSDDASTSEESSSVAEESAAKAASAPKDTNSATEVYGEGGLSVATNSGTYQLSGDVYQTSTVRIAGDTTVDLNGWHVYYKGSTKLFDVEGGTLTITDSNPATDTPTKDTRSEAEAGTENVGSITYKGSIPTNITYYVTESNPDGISTTETRWQHTVRPGGFITAEAPNGADSVISMKSGKLNIEGGTICMPNSASHGPNCHIIYAGGGTFNLRGGYIAGGKCTSNWGGGVCLTGNATLNMSGGVITANEAKAGAGVYAAQGTTVNMTSNKAVISGNTVVAGTYDWKDEASDGYGGGIYAVGATVNVSGGYITNNCVNASYKDRHVGLIGGGGIAIMNDSSQASLAISGGYITENYSNEAGGGIYAGRWGKGLGEHFTLTGGTIASNVAQKSEGGGIRISGGTTATFSVDSGKAYITNNRCNSPDDWGGGGVFVQEEGKLYVKNALVYDNKSGGYGAGVAACPTGETVVTHTSGAAIYGNNDDVDINGQRIDPPHFSTPNQYKHEDYDVASFDTAFTTNGHADYFLVRAKSSTSYVTAVTGRMLGGGAAGWSGSVDGNVVNKVDANSGIEAKYLVGMTAHPTDSAKDAGISAATLIFSGNYAYNHGGGIMTNGGLTIGEVKNIDIYPGLKLNARKALKQDGKDASDQLSKVRYTFVLLSPTSEDSAAPSWKDGTLNYGGCAESARTTSDADGNIEFDVSSEYSQSGTYTYYVAELPNSNDTKTQSYDKTIYKITADVTEDESQRTTLPLLNITFKHYTISNLTVTIVGEPDTRYQPSTTTIPSTTTSDSIVDFTLTKDGNSSHAAFTNILKPYSTTGLFTPEVTKHVEGGEMKSFQFELYSEDGYEDGRNWDSRKLIDTTSITKPDGSDATVDFDPISYTLGVKDLDTKARGGMATYTYYIREVKGEESGYTYDGGYIEVKVKLKDDSNGNLTVVEGYPRYTYVGADGNQSKDEAKFNNTYAQTLPNAGQAGIALVYIAGGAALAYGLWRLIKSRHESRKGGDER